MTSLLMAAWPRTLTFFSFTTAGPGVRGFDSVRAESVDLVVFVAGFLAVFEPVDLADLAGFGLGAGAAASPGAGESLVVCARLRTPVEASASVRITLNHRLLFIFVPVEI